MPVRKKKQAAAQPAELAIVDGVQSDAQLQAEIEQPAAPIEDEFDQAAVAAEKPDTRSGDVLDMFAGAGMSEHAVVATNLFTTHGGAGLRHAYVDQRRQPQHSRDAQEEHERALNADVRVPFPPRGTKHDDGKAQAKVAAQAGAQHSVSTIDTMHGKLNNTRPRFKVS